MNELAQAVTNERNYTLKLTQLGAIISTLREQMKDAAKDPFRSGVLAALALVGEHASLQAKENSLQDRMAAQWERETSPVSMDNNTGREDQLATANSSPVPTEQNNIPHIAATHIFGATVDIAAPYVPPAVDLRQPVDWKKAAATLQKQVLDLQAQLSHCESVINARDERIADLTNDHNTVLDKFERLQLAHNELRHKSAELQSALKLNEELLNMYRERNIELEALATQMHGQGSTEN